MMTLTIFFAFLSGLMMALAGMMIYNYMTQESTNLMDRGCPEDLRMCPDGSSVVRVAPDCEFAPCPVSSEEEGEQLVMCTMDAKICPDGTGVGRVGPNCEFAPCPPEEELGDESKSSEPMMCTQEVKQCPGGKYVGRDPYNNCAFKPC